MICPFKSISAPRPEARVMKSLCTIIHLKQHLLPPLHGLDGAPGVVGHAVQLAHPPVGALDGLAVPRQLLGALPILLPRPLDALLLLLGGLGLLGHDRFDGLVDAGVAQRLGQGLQGREGDVADVLEGNVLGHLLQLGNQEGPEGRHGVGRLDEPAHVLDDDAAAALAEGLLLLEAAGQYGTKDGQSRRVDG